MRGRASPARSQGLEDVFDRLASAVVERRVCRIVYISFLDYNVAISISTSDVPALLVGSAGGVAFVVNRP